MKWDDQRGMVTLEACVSVLSFLILMLLLSSLFVMFMAQNMTAHALLQTAESLSLDVYTITTMKLDDTSIGSVGQILGKITTKLHGDSVSNPYFVTDTAWYDEQTTTEAAVRSRFIGYLAGGDEDRARELLKQMNVVKGLDGLDFSESYVADGTLYAVVKYELEYDFNIWNVQPEEVEQKACAKLWGISGSMLVPETPGGSNGGGFR